jgi:septal ring factor EnvC (AmiA/AmiB activator)
VIRRTMRALLPIAAVIFTVPAWAQDQAEEPGARYARAVAEAESFQRFNQQLEEQVRSQEEEIASIERQLVEIDTTNRAIQPLMQRMVDTLARFVELDIPFLREEREARVQNLQEAMSRADVSISEKYRLILEAYQTELDYGQTLQAYEGRLGTGADARTVEFARLGRVSLMYRTLDGSETGYWDANQKNWVVDPSYQEAVEEALRVAKDDGAPELLTVPVRAPQEVRS